MHSNGSTHERSCRCFVNDVIIDKSGKSINDLIITEMKYTTHNIGLKKPPKKVNAMLRHIIKTINAVAMILAFV